MNPILKLNLKRFLWSIAILLLVVGSDQLGWLAGHKAGRASQVQAMSPTAAKLGDRFVEVLQRVEQLQRERYASTAKHHP